MKEQIDNALEIIKGLDLDGCVTGSCLLGYFPKQDIDVFVYNENAFTKAVYALHYNPLFLLLDPIEQWKFKEWTEKDHKQSYKKFGLVSIKFTYNTCIEVNIIYKNNMRTPFDVLASFDLDILCKAYDLKSKNLLDLTNPSYNSITKTVSWNKWNKSFMEPNIWSLGRILRQFERVVKYHNRGFNTDLVTMKYKEIITDCMNYNNIFKSDKVDEKVDTTKTQGLILIQIIDTWLETHEELSPETLELLNRTIKSLEF